MPASAPERWEPFLTEDGTPTLRHRQHGQTCHSRSGAWLEARERFALPCRIEERARRAGCVRLLDVGTGVGWNLAAALASVQAGRGLLEAVTLECDPTVLAAASELRRGVPAALRGWQEAVGRALGASHADGGAPSTLHVGGRRAGHLRLLLGEALDTLLSLEDDLRFDVVFFDPFSRSVEPRSWSEELLRAVARRMDEGAVLATYSAALEVRATLRRAGLQVGASGRVGAKAQGTLAGRGHDPGGLDERTRRRIERRAGFAGRSCSAPGAPTAKG